MAIKLIKTKAKEIFTKTKLPGCSWAINQYVGCPHDCLYCYAKFIARWRPDSHGKWGSWIEAKTNAPELVKERYVDGWVYMSSVSDPYQPIERDLRLTEKILENLDKRIKLSVQTKSDLVLRDIKIFKKFENIEVGLTINSFEGKSKKIFEPFSPSNERRVKALKVLRENGIKTFAFVSPIIPGLIDFKDVIGRTGELADFYWFEFINTRGAGRGFMDVLKKEFPGSFDILANKKDITIFVEESKKIISSENIDVRGIAIH